MLDSLLFLLKAHQRMYILWISPFLSTLVTNVCISCVFLHIHAHDMRSPDPAAALGACASITLQIKSQMRLNLKGSLSNFPVNVLHQQFYSLVPQLLEWCSIYGGNYPEMLCNNITLNILQGHPGKEGPTGEKGHLVSFIFAVGFTSNVLH